MKSILVLILTWNVGSAMVPAEQQAFDNSLSMEQRWAAYHQALKKNPNDSYEIAKKAINSKDWYLREAGLKTYMALNPNKAKKYARDLFKNDPSLLVRSSALNALRILNDTSSEKLLWQSLNDPKNFRGDQSLWIRPKIVSTLLDFKLIDKKQFEKLKSDKDPQIVNMAHLALKK